MKVFLDRLNDAYHMNATNEQDVSIQIDNIGDEESVNGGFSPMQMLLAAAGGCSTIDIIRILKKQRQPLEDIHVEVEGDKVSKGTYSEFRAIHLHYTFKGDLDSRKVERAIELSLGKYCSVSKALEKTSEITSSYEIE